MSLIYSSFYQSMKVHLLKEPTYCPVESNPFFYFYPLITLIFSNPPHRYCPLFLLSVLIFHSSLVILSQENIRGSIALIPCTCRRRLLVSVSPYSVDSLMPGPMEELHSLDPRRQELLEARFTGAVSGNTVGSTGSTSGGAKVTTAQKILKPQF